MASDERGSRHSAAIPSQADTSADLEEQHHPGTGEPPKTGIEVQPGETGFASNEPEDEPLVLVRVVSWLHGGFVYEDTKGVVHTITADGSEVKESVVEELIAFAASHGVVIQRDKPLAPATEQEGE